MISREQDTAGWRPFNNLLRRLNDADFALVDPHLVAADANPNDLLYSPGDGVETVHFPCGPSLVSYMVTNEDGRDVETILIGREGAVGGIVSQGYLPAYTRITVKFAGPFVRLPVGKLDAAKSKSRTLSNIFARYADCMLAQIFQSTAFGDGTHRRRRHRAADPRATGDAARCRPFLYQPGHSDLQGGRHAGDPPRLDPGPQPGCAPEPVLPLQRGG
jgi:hypothetical protein